MESALFYVFSNSENDYFTVNVQVTSSMEIDVVFEMRYGNNKFNICGIKFNKRLFVLGINKNPYTVALQNYEQKQNN